MTRTGFRLQLIAALMALLAACGSENGTAPATGPAEIRGTVAYVENECREQGGALTLQQSLRLRAPSGSVATALSLATLGPVDLTGICELFALGRLGLLFTIVGAFQRLAVSPDASSVVFEITPDFSIAQLNPVASEQQGIFLVRSDGSGLRRLGDASREPPFLLGEAEDQLAAVQIPGFAFSPNSRLLALVDRVTEPDGEESSQIFTLDVRTGERRQITHLPPVPAADTGGLSTCCPNFLDDRTLAFSSLANPGGMNPDGELTIFIVNTDGTGLRIVPLPIAEPGARFVPTFSITGERPTAGVFYSPEDAINGGQVQEIFLVDGQNTLQLTRFQRSDTGTPFFSRNDARAYFVASANPLGGNPDDNCQIFSIDRNGANLSQLTDFDDGVPSANGCLFGPPPGCAVELVGQDPATHDFVLYSSCDPAGTNPNGGQLFAIRPDGSGLTQITSSRGLLQEPNGDTLVELPGPYAFSTSP